MNFRGTSFLDIDFSSSGILCARHYYDVIMGTVASQITSLMIVYSTVYSDADQRKHQSSASLAFVWEIRWPVNSPHKWPLTRKMFPFDDVIKKLDDGSAMTRRSRHLISGAYCIAHPSWPKSVLFTNWHFRNWYFKIKLNPSNHIHSELWGEINHPFPHFKGCTVSNFSSCTVEVWEKTGYFILHLLSMWLLTHAGIKVVIKRGHMCCDTPPCRRNETPPFVAYNENILHIFTPTLWDSQRHTQRRHIPYTSLHPTKYFEMLLSCSKYPHLAHTSTCDISCCIMMTS